MVNFDRYTLKARIQPVLFTVLPWGIALSGWMPGDSLPVGVLLGVIGTCGGTALLSQFGRDEGKKKQPALWESWGGAPTTQLLRFCESANSVLLSQRRAKLEKLTGYPLPTRHEESEDPKKADQQYEAAIHVLIESTRDTARFPLVFAENINYGFRRNLWGLKPYGLVISALATLGSLGLFLSLAGLPTSTSWLSSLLNDPDLAHVVRLCGLFCNIAIVAMWLFIITPQWVRIPAQAYAERLLGSLDKVP